MRKGALEGVAMDGTPCKRARTAWGDTADDGGDCGSESSGEDTTTREECVRE